MPARVATKPDGRRPSAERSHAAVAGRRHTGGAATAGQRRLLTASEAAAYVGCRSAATFRREVARGIWPPPLPLAGLSGGRKRQVWDLLALDTRIDDLTGHAPAANDIDLDWEMGLGDD